MISKLKIKRTTYFNLDGTVSSEGYKVTVVGAQTYEDMNVYTYYRDKTFSDFKQAREHIRQSEKI